MGGHSQSHVRPLSFVCSSNLLSDVCCSTLNDLYERSVCLACVSSLPLHISRKFLLSIGGPPIQNQHRVTISEWIDRLGQDQ